MYKIFVKTTFTDGHFEELDGKEYFSKELAKFELDKLLDDPVAGLEVIDSYIEEIRGDHIADMLQFFKLYCKEKELSLENEKEIKMSLFSFMSYAHRTMLDELMGGYIPEEDMG